MAAPGAGSASRDGHPCPGTTGSSIGGRAISATIARPKIERSRMNDAVATTPRASVHSRFVSHFECSLTGERYTADRYRGLSEHGKPLFVRYDLAAIRAAVTRDAVCARAPDM